MNAEVQSLQEDRSALNISTWIKLHISWCTAQDAALIRTACGLIENRELLIQSLSVAKVLGELTVDAELLVAGLVFHATSNGDISILTVKMVLGAKIHKLILTIQRIDLMLQFATMNYKQMLSEANLENLSKMFLMSEIKLQAIMIKIATQICVMRGSINTQEIIRLHLIHQAQNVLIPLSKCLNIERFNWELEDLAFKILQPKIYKEITKSLAERRHERERYILKIKQELEMRLKLYDIEAEVFGRAKHIYSIWGKMQRKMSDYNRIHDLHAFRIIVPSIMDCYAALEVVHTFWQHIPEEFKDYISSPKRNGYKSLHTKIIGADGKVLEVQFRTKQIHQEAESGNFAHWRYKYKNGLQPPCC